MFGAYGSKISGAIAGFGPARDGSIAILVALLLPILVGGMALAIDLSRAANLQTELQDVADAAALAGATQLDHTTGAQDRAIQAAAVEATRLVENSQRFGANFEAAVEIDDNLTGNTDIKFFSDLAMTPAASDDTANYIEVTVAPRTVTFLFAGVLGVLDRSPTARAVAGYDELACPSQPMFICNPDEPTGGGNANAPFAVHDYKGFGITIEDNRSGFVSANGITGSDVACANIARVNSTNPECLDAAVDGSGRLVSTIGECVNVRLDIYPDGNGTVGGLAGSRTDSAFAPAVNVVKGLVHPDQTTVSPFTIPSSEICEINNEWNSPVAEYLGPGQHTSASLPDTMTYPHDNCAYGGTPCELGDGVWDIGTYAATQHSDTVGSDPGLAGPGLQSDVNAWLTAQDLDFNDDGNDPGDLPTRYEVYLWEVNNDDPGTSDANASCSTQLAPPGKERRVITVAVVNCNAGGVVNGFFTDAPLARPSAVDLFLTEPLGASDSDSYYVEIIGPSVVRKRVVLYE